MFDRAASKHSPGRSLVVWVLSLLATTALVNLPQSLVLRLRACHRQCVLPVQNFAVLALGPSPQTTGSSQQDLATLDERRAEIITAVGAALARVERQPAAESSQAEPLLLPTAIEARVIGQQGRSFFAHALELNVGLADAVLPRAWVLDQSLPLVDQGHASGLERGHLVLAGRRVCGQVREVGEHASTVQQITSPGYRDLVQLAGPSSAEVRRGARGILEGDGQPLCRIRMVKATEPVEAGDLVLSAGGDELLPTPLVYGRIVRAERPRGGVHWNLWMEPASSAIPERVTVVRISLNAARLAQSQSGRCPPAAVAEESRR